MRLSNLTYLAFEINAAVAACLAAAFALGAWHNSRQALLIQRDTAIATTRILEFIGREPDPVQSVAPGGSETVIVRFDVKHLEELKATLQRLQERLDEAWKTHTREGLADIQKDLKGRMGFRSPEPVEDILDIPF